MKLEIIFVIKIKHDAYSKMSKYASSLREEDGKVLANYIACNIKKYALKAASILDLSGSPLRKEFEVTKRNAVCFAVELLVGGVPTCVLEGPVKKTKFTTSAIT